MKPAFSTTPTSMDSYVLVARHADGAITKLKGNVDAVRRLGQDAEVNIFWLFYSLVRPMELNQVTLPALDIAASVAFYRAMGFQLIVDSPNYARFKSTVGTTTFSVHAIEALAEASKIVVYFECSSLDQQVAELQKRGFAFLQEPQDEPWLWREARLQDPSGNVICLYHAGQNRLNPPWRVGA